MTFFDELGIRAAEQLESSVGAYLALASYKRLFSAEEPIRSTAVLGALRCAVDLGDGAETEELTELWADATDASGDVAGLVIKLVRGQKWELAMNLAVADSRRKPSSRSFYLVARVGDLSGKPSTEAWALAIERARGEGQKRALTASVARWLELVLGSSSPPPSSVSNNGPLALKSLRQTIVEYASLADLEGASEGERLTVSRAQLLSPSKFQRCGALSELGRLAREGSPNGARHAILACVNHADTMQSRLQPLEVDRVRAALKYWPDMEARESALKRLDVAAEIDRFSGSELAEASFDELLSRLARDFPETTEVVQRVRALVRGGSARRHHDSSDGGLELRLASLGLDALTALERGTYSEAARSIARAADGLPPWAAIPPVLYAACMAALSKKDVSLKKTAGAFMMLSLARSFGGPPNGFLEFGLALIGANLFDEAEAVLIEARRANEAGATELLAELERRLAYKALDRGDRGDALVRLSRARTLFGHLSVDDRR